MKRTALLFVAMTSVLQYSKAQNNWSIGLRTGAEPSRCYNLAGMGSKEIGIVLQEQLFVTQRISNHFEVEINASIKSNVTNSEFINQVWDGPEYWTSTTTYHSIDAGLAVRYFVFSKNDWEPYVLAGINATRRYSTINTLLKEWNKNEPILHQLKTTENDIPSEMYLGLGVNKVISPKWKCNAQLSLTYSCSGSGQFTYYAFHDYSPKAQVGFAYCW